ncbi:uncharacterized protein N0V96_000576 [Colletotrichum fioriniae]|uniref:uncharacterized protein n=1 Tax=Colletotrichum fioriniae TaxID=710243 RepID=UPI0032D9C17D|nr:hypothetical protein N0V96_000576 [Colletotrichum fioriniae]
MDLFQRLDEDVSNLIIEHDFLNLDTLRFATEREVERAAVRALEMATPDQQLAIAMRQSIMAIEGDNNTNNDENDANHNNATNNPGNIVNNEDTGGYISWDERNRLLTDTRNNSAETSDAEDNNNNNTNNDDDDDDDRTECVVCFTTRQPLHRLPCGCRMCPRCLRRCLRAGLRPGGWPPRCCQPLQPDNVEQAAGMERPRLVRLYRQVRVEEETPGEERVYCARPECAAFIPAGGGAAAGDDAMFCPAVNLGKMVNFLFPRRSFGILLFLLLLRRRRRLNHLKFNRKLNPFHKQILMEFPSRTCKAFNLWEKYRS